jgi:hypothetical protein
MKGYDRNVILLTDGQVENQNEVIELIKKMKNQKIATTHTIGVGNGVSFDMIKKGAFYGGGEHLFIMKDDEMQKQIIYLLESITKGKIKNFNIIYNDNIIKNTEPPIQANLKKNKPNTFFLKFNAPTPS